jgi:ribose transport system ATP-binding protein
VEGFVTSLNELVLVDSQSSALTAANVSKSFGGTHALVDFSMTIAAGEVRALVGGNGSGKSTFIKILSGYHRPDPGGQITVGGAALSPGDSASSRRIGARFVHQDLGLADDISILDNLAAANGYPTLAGTVRGHAARQAASRTLARVGLTVDPGIKVKQLSAAEKTGVALARTLDGLSEGHVKLLVLDEPTATLPAAEVRQVLQMVHTVADQGIGVLYVTHRLDEIFELGATITVLRNGRHVVDGSSDSMTRADLVRYLVGSELADVRDEADHTAQVRPDSALEVSHLRSEHLDDVSFNVAHGEVVGISGVTGSGRESIVGLLFGREQPTGGEIRVGGRRIRGGRPRESIKSGMAFLPADRKTESGLMGLTIRENLTIPSLSEFWRPPFMLHGRERAVARAWFERLGIRPVGGEELLLSRLSGGNQQKVLVAKWLRIHPSVLLFDEPTQGVDVAAKAEIHHQLLSAAASDGAAVVVASSDIDELVAISHRVLILRHGRVVAELAGSRITVAAVTKEMLVSDVSERPVLSEVL